MNTNTTNTAFTTAPTMAYSLRTMNHALAIGRSLGQLIARLTGASALAVVAPGVDATL